MKVLVCDDNKADLLLILRMLSSYAKKHGKELALSACSADAEIEDAMSHSEKYDILFLDICLEKLNGMDLARRIRETNRESEIVFVSSSRDYALDAFGVNAKQYLLKPPTEQALEEVMNQLFLVREGGIPRCLNIRSENHIRRIAFSDIEYAEKCRNDICFHLTGGRYYLTRMTLNELFATVSNEREFVMLGKSYVVNLRHVRSLSGTELETDSHSCLSVPRGAYAELKARYFDFYSLR